MKGKLKMKTKASRKIPLKKFKIGELTVMPYLLILSATQSHTTMKNLNCT